MSRDGSIETWSRLVVDETELPEPARDIILDEYRVFPYCVSAPASRGLYGKMPPTLLCLGESKLGIVKVLGNECEPRFLRLEECDAFESGTNLLLSWIAFNHAGQRHVVWFNTVSGDLYKPFVEAYRTASEQGTSDEGDVDAYLEPMIRLDYKYFTYPRSVLAGRLPDASFYHPKVKAQGGVFRPRIISSYYLVRARGIVYVFSEEHILRSPRVANYSMVIRHVPIALRRIASRIERGSDLYSWFALRVDRNEVMRLPVEKARLQEFMAFAAPCGIEPGRDGDETAREA